MPADGLTLSCFKNDEQEDKEERKEILTALVDTITEKSENFYDMKFSYNGYLVGFLQQSFSKMLKPKTSKFIKPVDRKAAEKDRDLLYNCFGKKLNFKIDICDDYRKDKIKKKIKKLVKMDSSKYATLAIVVSSHGYEDDLICAENGLYYLKELWEPLVQSKAWEGKPKMFFVQACRGDAKDYGCELEEKLTEDLKTDSVSDGANLTSSPCSDYKIPTSPDILIYNSCYPGYESYNNKIEGSVFIRYLCKQLEECGTKQDLLTNITMVNKQICHDYYTHDGKDKVIKQCPVFLSTLKKNILFSKK